jgi:uncharacterized lipoprotein YmbA
MRTLVCILLGSILVACATPEMPPETVYLRVKQVVPGCPVESQGGAVCDVCPDTIQGTAIVIGGATLAKYARFSPDPWDEGKGTWVEPPSSRWTPIEATAEQEQIRYRLNLTILDSHYRRMTIEEAESQGNVMVIRLANPHGERSFHIYLGPTIAGKDLVCGLDSEWLQCSRYQEV